MDNILQEAPQLLSVGLYTTILSGNQVTNNITFMYRLLVSRYWVKHTKKPIKNVIAFIAIYWAK